MDKHEKLLWSTGLLPAAGTAERGNLEIAAKAFGDAGIRVLELPADLENFEEAAAVFRKDGRIVLAVSGIRTLEDCVRAVEHGAGMILSDALRTELADWCREKGVTYVPACTTAAEISQALDRGICTVLYTPCFSPEPCSVLDEMGKDRGLKFIVSGGVDKENFLEYADKPYILAVRGAFLWPGAEDCGDDRKAAAWAEGLYLENLGFALGHVGVSTASDEEGHALADELSGVFGMQAEHGHVGNWSLARGIEIVNGKGPGLHGHIAVQCNNVERAICYLENHGHKVKRESFRFRYPGRLSFAYLEEEFGGFAIHLMLRWTAP